MFPFVFPEVFVTFVKEKGQDCWAGITGAPQAQDREGALCLPSSISSSFLQSCWSCHPGEASQELELCAGLGEADVDVGGKNPFQSSARREREASNSSKRWAASRAGKERELFFPLTPPHHPKATT